MQEYYYVRSDDYLDLLEGRKVGCFPVPLVHSAVLVDIRKKVLPSYKRPNETVPEDDIIIWAVTSRDANISNIICNDLEYGYVVSPLEDEVHLYQDMNRALNLRVEIASKNLSNDFHTFIECSKFRTVNI